MSRGPGEVMRKVLVLTSAFQDEYGAYATYRGLATFVYEVDDPSRAQLSAVARAARRLEQDGLVEIFAYADDQREKVVGLSPWIGLAFFVLGAEGPDSGATMQYSDLVALTQAARELIEMGMVEGFHGGKRIDPHNRPLLVNGVRGDHRPVLRAGRDGR